MIECTSRGSTLLSCAALSTISEMLIDGEVCTAEEVFAGATLRTSFPVRRSARTTKVFCEAESARMGEAASMVSAVIKQIYTFLFVDILAAVATIISWKAEGLGSCWQEGSAPAWAETKRCCHGEGPL